MHFITSVLAYYHIFLEFYLYWNVHLLANGVNFVYAAYKIKNLNYGVYLCDLTVGLELKLTVKPFREHSSIKSEAQTVLMLAQSCIE